MPLRKVIRDHKFQRRLKRVEKVGSDGVNKQDKRRRALGKDPKKLTVDSVRRVGEYKRGKVIDKVKRFKNPLNK